MSKPYLITLPRISSKAGQLSFIQEGKDLPISVKRLYWIYDISDDVMRGGHAHINSDRVLVCVRGMAEVSLEDEEGNKYTFVLDDPFKVLYFPRLHWIHLRLMKDSVLVVCSSCTYEDDCMINDYATFKQHRQTKLV